MRIGSILMAILSGMLLFISPGYATESEITIVENGTSEWSILVSPAALPSAKEAASRFALSPICVEGMNRWLPLGVITEMPAGRNLKLLLKEIPEPVIIDGVADEKAWEKAACIEALKNNKPANR